MTSVEFLFSLEQFGMKFGLSNIAALCAALGNPQDTFPSIIVAGTNGKGSVTAMVDTGLRAAGHLSARYTSPHLQRLEERFVIFGEEVASGALEAAAGRVRAAAEMLVASGALASLPTFFECTTAVAFDLFRERQVDVAVLEVGLGGRLDSTNIVSPIAAAIVSIDFDHQEQLGHSLASIAAEKAGVIKPGIPVVCGPLPPEALEVIASVCAERGAALIRTDTDAALAGRIETMPVSLPGAHQRANAAVALRLLEVIDRDTGRGLPVGPEARRAGRDDGHVAGADRALRRRRVSGRPRRGPQSGRGARAGVLSSRGRAAGSDAGVRRDARQGGARDADRAGAGDTGDPVRDGAEPARDAGRRAGRGGAGSRPRRGSRPESGRRARARVRLRPDGGRGGVNLPGRTGPGAAGT